MSGNSRFYIVISILMILIMSVVGAYYLLFMKPLGERLGWVSGMYMQCKSSSTVVHSDDVFWDLQEVALGKYDKRKLEFYGKKIEQYFEGKCSDEDAVICEDSFLYVLKTFLLRGNEKDRKLASSMLIQYKKMQGVNIYYDSMFLDVSLYHAWKTKEQEGYYSNLIDQIKGHYLEKNYFNKPHGAEMCDIYLNLIGVTYAKSGDYAADVYIQYHIRN